MVNKKFQEYVDMSTRAKGVGGANNYQALLVALGFIGGGLGKTMWDYFRSKNQNRKYEKRKKEFYEKTYLVTHIPEGIDELLGNAKQVLSVGSKYSIVGNAIKIDNMSTVYISIVGDDNNPYLVTEEALIRISDYIPLNEK